MFTAQALKKYVTSTRKFGTFHDFLPISHALLFPALSESYIFCLFIGESAGRKSERETLAFLGLAAKASDTKQHRLKLQLG